MTRAPSSVITSTLALACGLLLGRPDPAGAQAPEPDRPPAALEAAGSAGDGRLFVYSLTLPGAGQRALGSDRWIPYAAVEVWGWLRYFDRRGAGRSYERDYRDLAWSVARRISTGPRREGRWDYYEAMARYPASGAFDVAPDQPGLQPEPDERTYNGSIWALARAIYFPAGVDSMPPDSPEFQQALEYYRTRAIPPEFAWSWGEHGLEQQAYVELIRRSDEALRAATTLLGMILANHLVSGVDALVSARLREARRGAPPVELESGIHPGPDPLRWYVGVRVRTPRR